VSVYQAYFGVPFDLNVRALVKQPCHIAV